MKEKRRESKILHIRYFSYIDCIQLTSNSIIPFCASRFMFAIRFCINVSLKSRYINEIFPRSCEGYIFWSEPFIHVNDAFICKIHPTKFRILSTIIWVIQIWICRTLNILFILNIIKSIHNKQLSRNNTQVYCGRSFFDMMFTMFWG